jgi:4a-hydroxytetrahydrobiopterin dehydratase
MHTSSAMSELAERKCKACNKETPRLSADEQRTMAREVPEWTVADERLRRRYVFRSFPASIRFVDEMARIAEDEGHHPIFTVDYDKVDVVLWTHAIGGLSENDFILAAKLDRAGASVGNRA